MTPQTILVLEDEPIIRLDLELAIEDSGWSPMLAGDVETAMSLIDGAAPAVAILDLNLGNGMTSRPVAERLRAAGVPFLILTGDYHVDKEWIDALGAVVLRKPHVSDDVIESAIHLAGQGSGPETAG